MEARPRPVVYFREIVSPGARIYSGQTARVAIQRAMRGRDEGPLDPRVLKPDCKSVRCSDRCWLTGMPVCFPVRSLHVARLHAWLIGWLDRGVYASICVSSLSTVHSVTQCRLSLACPSVRPRNLPLMSRRRYASFQATRSHSVRL